MDRPPAFHGELIARGGLNEEGHTAMVAGHPIGTSTTPWPRPVWAAEHRSSVNTADAVRLPHHGGDETRVGWRSAEMDFP